MRDKSLGVFLMVLFGISGMAVLLLVWLLPTLESERTMAIFVGSAGLLVALIQVLALKRSSGRMDDEQDMVTVEAENRS